MILDTAAFRSMVRQDEPPQVMTDNAGLHVCRLVFDPEDDLFGPIRDLSAVGRSIAMGMRYARGASDAQGQLQRARSLLVAKAVHLVDMTDEELHLWSAVEHDSRERMPLGLPRAASATIAIAKSRSWPVVTADVDVATYLHATGAPMVAMST